MPLFSTPVARVISEPQPFQAQFQGFALAVSLLFERQGKAVAMRDLDFGGQLIRVGILTILFVVGSASVVRAGDTPLSSWMAASSSESTLTGRSWGRLTLEDGELRFESPVYKWRIALSEIKRVESSKAAGKTFEIETAAGAIYFAAILDATMMKDSPRKAIQMIQRGIRDARETAAAPRLIAKGPR